MHKFFSLEDINKRQSNKLGVITNISSYIQVFKIVCHFVNFVETPKTISKFLYDRKMFMFVDMIFKIISGKCIYYLNYN